MFTGSDVPVVNLALFIEHVKTRKFSSLVSDLFGVGSSAGGFFSLCKDIAINYNAW